MKSDLTLGEQMGHYKCLLMSVVQDFRYLFLQRLLSLAIKSKRYSIAGSFY